MSSCVISYSTVTTDEGLPLSSHQNVRSDPAEFSRFGRAKPKNLFVMITVEFRTESYIPRRIVKFYCTLRASLTASTPPTFVPASCRRTIPKKSTKQFKKHQRFQQRERHTFGKVQATKKLPDRHFAAAKTLSRALRFPCSSDRIWLDQSCAVV